MKSVSIIIPAYNEEKRLPETLEKIKNYLSGKDFEYEVLLINDGSTDDTAKTASGFSGVNVKVISNKKNMGKGYCVNKGVFEAKNDIILFTDADLSTPIDSFDRFYSLHEKGYDVVIASRAVDRKLVKKRQPWIRETMGRIFNVFVRAVTGLKISDTQCGFKSFKRAAAKEIFSKQTIFGFGFDVEILYIARLQGRKIHETAVEWYDSPGTKVSALKDSARMFIELFIIRLKNLAGKYN